MIVKKSLLHDVLIYKSYSTNMVAFSLTYTLLSFIIIIIIIIHSFKDHLKYTQREVKVAKKEEKKKSINNDNILYPLILFIQFI